MGGRTGVLRRKRADQLRPAGMSRGRGSLAVVRKWKISLDSTTVAGATMMLSSETDRSGGTPMLKIGDFSKLSRVSIRLLRHYDEIGLLKPVWIDP